MLDFRLLPPARVVWSFLFVVAAVLFGGGVLLGSCAAHATAFPVEPVPFVDAPVASALPSGATFDVSALPHWLQTLLVVLGAVVPVASFAADFLDRYAKAKVARGEKIPAWMEAFGSAAHAAGANPRKAVKLAKSALGKAKGGES